MTVLEEPAFAAGPRTLSVVAGTGSSGAPTTGAAAADSRFRGPDGVAPDGSGGAYLSDGDSLRVYHVTSGGGLEPFAGNGTFGITAAGTAVNQPIGAPGHLALDSQGRVYLASGHNRQIYRVDPGTGQLSIVAGTGHGGTCSAGPATSSSFDEIGQLAFDSADNLYVADVSGGKICKIAPNGTLSVFAGLAQGPLTDGHISTVGLDAPIGVAVDDDDNVYVADWHARKVARINQSGTVTIIAGTGDVADAVPGPAIDSPLRMPSSLAIDGDTLYIGHIFDPRVAAVKNGELTIVAGSGNVGTPVAGVATDSPFGRISSLATDTDGSLLIANLFAPRVMRLSPGSRPPHAPAGVQYDPGRERIDISFEPPADPGGSAIDHYEVTIDNGGHWDTLVTEAGPAGRRTGVVGSLVNGRPYQVGVRAVNDDGPGAASPIQTVTPEADAPGRPTGLVVESADSGLRVRFSPPGDDGGDEISGYEISVDDGVHWDPLATATANGLEAGTVGGLVNGESYAVRVRAVNGSGSGTASSTEPGVPGVPTPPLDVKLTAGSSSITAEWTAPATLVTVTGYRVIAYPGPATCTTTTGTRCVLGAEAGREYRVRVEALASDDLRSERSEASNRVTPARPDVPGQPPASDGDLDAVPGGDGDGITAGGTLALDGDGYAAYSTVVVTVYSTPSVLASVTTDRSGAFAATVTLPATLSAGAHTAVAAGVDPIGRPYALTASITVIGNHPFHAVLPITGASTWLIITIGLITCATGVGLLIVAGPRRRAVPAGLATTAGPGQGVGHSGLSMNGSATRREVRDGRRAGASVRHGRDGRGWSCRSAGA